MRGKEGEKVLVIDQERITPAYAGKRLPPLDAASLSRDHPRICGEKKIRLVASGECSGSPPHMRGKVSALESGASSHRITPAYAGKRIKRYGMRMCRRDHPRICGEKYTSGQPEKSRIGSPPHMRGKGAQRHDDEQRYGITPAYAGKRLLIPRYASVIWDHPRICGEKFAHCGHRQSRRGITPAYAGKRSGQTQKIQLH